MKLEIENTRGLNNLENCYDKGIGMEKGEHKILIHYQKFADIGNFSKYLME